MHSGYIMKINDITGFMDIDDHDLLFVKGPDARKFLQGQVTCDVEQLTIAENSTGQEASYATLGAHCTHKGRMIFSFIACAWDEQTIALSVHKDLLQTALAALKKYSVFSKVELIDASDSHSIIGFIGTPLSSIASLFPTLPEADGEVIYSNGAAIINKGNHRYECWITQEQAASLSSDDTATVESNEVWTACNIRDGIGEVRPETSEEFIPQMLNYQATGTGISFTKGCYTGQEIVARMQYLGKQKRHMYRFSSDTSDTLVPGSALYTQGKQQSIGNIVIAAKYAEQQELLAVATEAAVTADQVYIDENCQQKLIVLPLPYEITAEE